MCGSSHASYVKVKKKLKSSLFHPSLPSSYYIEVGELFFVLTLLSVLFVDVMEKVPDWGTVARI